jgi:iron complex outermembrane receptor protein
MLHRAIRAAAGWLAAASASICIAQQDAVIVNATRFPEDVGRLPASTTVITSEDIQRSAARTLPELLSSQVGVTMTDFYGNNASTTFIDLRGWGITGSQNTLILLDGRRLNDFDLSGVQWATIPLVQIERIEILRGTGAVLYGDGASSGVINIVTRSPLKRGYTLDAYGRAASYYTREGQLFGSIANETFGASASVYGYDSDGYRRNNRDEQQNTAMNLRWALGEGALDLRAGTDSQDIRFPGNRLVQPSIGLNQYATDRRGTSTPDDFGSRDGLRAGLGLAQRWGGVDFSAGLDYRGKDQRTFAGLNGFPNFRDDKLEFTSFTPRVRVPFDTGGITHSLTAGFDWNYWSYRSRRTDVPEHVDAPTNRVSVKQETQGLYAQDSVNFTSSTVATAGYRVERAKYTGDDVADSSAPGCTFPPCAAAPSVRATQQQSAWELGLRQGLSAGWALFARIGKSFRFATSEEIYENNQFFLPEFQVLQPQTAKTYEAGTEWRGRGSFARANVFRTDVSNEIHLDPFTTGVGNTNLPPSRRQGFELEGRWQASEGLLLNAGYTYTEAHFLEGTLPGGPFAIGIDIPIAGKEVPLVPRHKFNAGASLDLPYRMRLSANWTWVSSEIMDNDEPNTLGTRIPAWNSLDLKLAQHWQNVRLAVMVNNLFNSGYYTYAVRSAFTADRYGVYPLPGRTVGVSGELVFP